MSVCCALAAGLAAKKAKQELQERVDNAQSAQPSATVKPAALPAFLQTSSVAATYGNGAQAPSEEQPQG